MATSSNSLPCVNTFGLASQYAKASPGMSPNCSVGIWNIGASLCKRPISLLAWLSKLTSLTKALLYSGVLFLCVTQVVVCTTSPLISSNAREPKWHILNKFTPNKCCLKSSKLERNIHECCVIIAVKRKGCVISKVLEINAANRSAFPSGYSVQILSSSFLFILRPPI